MCEFMEWLKTQNEVRIMPKTIKIRAIDGERSEEEDVCSTVLVFWGKIVSGEIASATSFDEDVPLDETASGDAFC